MAAIDNISSEQKFGKPKVRLRDRIKAMGAPADRPLRDPSLLEVQHAPPAIPLAEQSTGSVAMKYGLIGLAVQNHKRWEADRPKSDD